MVQEITSNTLYPLLQNPNVLLIDVRHPEDYAQNHIDSPNQLNIPYNNFFKAPVSIPKEQKIVVVCAKGISSLRIADILHQQGYDASSLAGGLEEWNSLYLSKSLLDRPDLQITQFIRPSKGCLSYLIVSQGEGALIDPGKDIDVYLEFLAKTPCRIKYVFDTHAHADHISGGRALSSHFGVPYYLHPYDAIHPMDMVPAAFPYTWLDKNYSLGTKAIQTLHIPGHTLGNSALLVDSYLFDGDSIFIDSVSRPDLGEQTEKWTALHYNSLQSLLKLPEDIVVLPSHYGSLEESNADQTFHRTLAELKKSNHGLVMAQKPYAEFKSYILKNLPPIPPAYVTIKRINLGLVPANPHIETGRNVCAIKSF